MVLFVLVPLVLGIVSFVMSLVLGITKRIIPVAIVAGLAWAGYRYLVDQGTISGF